MLRVGLTGGIGSGKSTVCQLFTELGAPVIDADAIAHQLAAPGQAALGQLVTAFGSDILDQQGHLDRALLRKRIFRDEHLRKQLEAILHPLIRKRMREQLAAIEAPYVIVAIPLLFEKGWQSEVDRILVVDADEALQLERAARRDGVSLQAVKKIMQSQVTRQHRRAAADDILQNDGGYSKLRGQVEELHKRYLRLASAPEVIV